jgi:soluble lytic murein transglycosylase
MGCVIIRRVLRTPFVTSLLILSVTAPARADAPFTTWADGAGTAVVALSSGDVPAALRASSAAMAAVTKGEWGARSRLLAASALERDHRPADAAATIATALDSLPVTLRPAARARQAADLGAAGRPAEAAAAWALAAAGADPSDRPLLAAAEARAWLAAGEPREAARAAEAGGDTPAARLALARAWVALGDPRATATLRALALERPGTTEGEEAARALVASSPGALTLADRVDRARQLLAAGRTTAALGEIDAIDGLLGPVPLPAVLRAMALLQLGRPADAERIASPVALLPGPGEPAAARFVLARAAARQGRIEEAVSLYRRVARERPIVPGLTATQQADLSDDAAFLAAWLPYDIGRYDEVARALGTFLRERPGARRAQDARWFLAWSLYRSGDRASARTALLSLAQKESGNLRAAALYWQARIDPDPGRSASAYQAAVTEVPGGWYALLSAARLEQLSVPVPPSAPLPPSPLPDPPRDPRIAAAMALAVELAGTGLREESAAVLQRLSRGPDVRARAALLAEVAAFSGDAEVAYRMARDHLAPGIRAQRLAYPDAHADVLRPAARALGVDRALALSVMRRESGFVSAARSAAAAEGLLQLRPETARRLGALVGFHGDSDLADPAENTRLGVAYLALLSDRFASPAQVLAAYNAGPTAAAAWSRARAGLPLDEWVEDIPYRETRQYVRAVVSDWARYRLLAGEPAPPLDPAAPISPPAPGVAF